MNKKYAYTGIDYYSVSRNEYYERFAFPNNPSFFTQIFQSKNTVLPSNIPIAFRELHFGDKPEIVSSKFGMPRYILENRGISSQIFFYKEKINQHLVITQLHFLHEEFFCASYTFRDDNNAERVVIKKMIFEKYANMNGTTFETCNSLFDNSGNHICIFDNVFLHILYLWGDEKVKRAVSGSIRSSNFSEATKKEKLKGGLFDKL